MTLSNTVGTYVGSILAILVIVFGVGIIFSLPVMWCWNFLMPEIFGLEKISLFQSWVMLLLSGFLFKSTSITNSKG